MAEKTADKPLTPKGIDRILNAVNKYTEQYPWVKNLILIPAVWAVVSAGVSGLLYGGVEFGRYVYKSVPVSIPEPFRDDRIGILIARFENDPGGEYSLRVRTALERQFPVAADGSAAVEVDFYPEALEVPAQGRLSENLERARNEGLEWLEELNAELLIWGRAIPSEKELELRILARQTTASVGVGVGRPELYPIRIPSEFSDQIGAALAGLVAGAGFNAWSQRGEFLTHERSQSLMAWLARLKKLRDEIPASLDDANRNEIHAKITTAYAQVGAALIADGHTDVAAQVIGDLMPGGDSKEKSTLFDSDPLLFAEIIADVVARFSVEAGNIGEDSLTELLEVVNGASEEFKKRHVKGEIDDNAFSYLTGLMCMLAGDLTARIGDAKEAITHYSDGRGKFQSLLKTGAASQDRLSRARLVSYLGDVELGLAQQLEAPESESVLASSIANLGKALQGVNPKTAPREAVRIQVLLASAYYHRWAKHFDARALKRTIEALEQVANISNDHGRALQAASTRTKAAMFLGIHGYIASGVESARRSIALLDSIVIEKQDAGAGGRTSAALRHQQAAAGHARCTAHVAAVYRTEEAAGASEDLKLAEESCEAAATLYEQAGDRYSWLNVRLLHADALTIKGEKAGDPQALRAALAMAEDVERQAADLDEPIIRNRIAGTKGAVLRALGVLEKQPLRLKEAVLLHRAARDSLPDDAGAIQHLLADLQLGRSLTAFAVTENNASNELKEGIHLLSQVRDKFAARGAGLVARDASQALEKAERHLVRLGTN